MAYGTLIHERAKGRRYLLELGLAMGVYAAAVITLGPLVTLDMPRIVAVGAALAPMAPLSVALIAILRHLRRLDELQLQVCLQSVGFAFAGTFVVTSGYGIVSLFAQPPRVGIGFAWPVMGALWMFGLAIASLPAFRDEQSGRTVKAAAYLAAGASRFTPPELLQRIRPLDELQVRIHLEAIGVAFACTALVTVAYGFLSWWAQFPHISIGLAWLVMSAFWLTGLATVRRRYR